MASIPYLYRRLRALGVPEASAAKFAEQGDSLTAAAVEDLDSGADLSNVIDKVNELLAGLRTAGAMDEE